LYIYIYFFKVLRDEDTCLVVPWGVSKERKRRRKKKVKEREREKVF
jgi:hypothetical protein